jgi:hypothetical protein
MTTNGKQCLQIAHLAYACVAQRQKPRCTELASFWRYITYVKYPRAFFAPVKSYIPMTPLKSTPGAKPRVDYCLVGHMEGEVVYKVPVEAQKFMTTDDLGQLAHYRGSMHYTTPKLSQTNFPQVGANCTNKCLWLVRAVTSEYFWVSVKYILQPDRLRTCNRYVGFMCSCDDYIDLSEISSIPNNNHNLKKRSYNLKRTQSRDSSPELQVKKSKVTFVYYTHNPFNARSGGA